MSGESLAAYIPIDRRLALASVQELPVNCKGTVLFADISGFTLFTSSLTEELGVQRGADEITTCLNLVYGAVITKVYHYRGSVISFAGDAITCWFDQDEGERALAAGSAIQKVMTEITQKYELPLQIKIVINHGPAYRFTVGNPDIQVMDLLVGRTVSDVNFAEKLASPGELLVSNSIANRYADILITNRSITTENGSIYVNIISSIDTIVPDPWEEQDLLSPEDVSLWILPDVLKKIKDSTDEFLAESRIAVNLFIKFAGLDYDRDSKSQDKIDQFIRWIQECLRRQEGHLLQVIIGDKGDYLFIGFGALAAHDDDPYRALAAANILIHPPESLSFITDIKIGISSGRMHTGPYGSSSRRTYSMLGADANLAARLMQKAEPGQILVTERVATAVQKKYLFNSLESLNIKGFHHSIPIFSLKGLKDASQNVPQYQTPLVGRQEELNQLIHYALGQDGRNRVIFMEGEGGMGKSRLLSDMITKLPEQEIINSFGYAIEKSTPYYIFRKIFRQFFNIENEPPSDLVNKVRNQVLEVNPEWDRWLPLLNSVLPLGFPENEITEQMEGDVKARNLHKFIVELLNGMTPDKKYLIILDDAHWIDEASWNLLNEITYLTTHIGFIISHRPFSENLSNDLVKLKENVSCLEIKLENFELSNTRKLISLLVGANDITQEVLSLIHDRTSGQPFFSEELVYSLLSSEMLLIKNDTCQLNKLSMSEALILPDTIQTAITSRLDRIAPTQQLTLKVASIIGRMFIIKALQGIHPMTSEFAEICHQLEEMTRINLTSQHAPEPELAYSFSQNITYEVAYGLLSHSQRQELHTKTALWYEKMYAKTIQQVYSRLGYHWLEAGEYDKAASYMEMAAFDASSKGAYKDCITFIIETLALEKHIKFKEQRRVLLLAELGLAYFKIGELEKANKQLKIAVRAYNRPAPSTTITLILNLFRQVLIQFYNRIKPKKNIVISDSDKKVRLKISQVYEYLAQSYYHLNKLFYSFNSALTGLNLAESAGPSSQLARGYCSICINTSTMSIPGLAEMYAKLANALLSKEIPLNDHGRILELLAIAWSGRGRWDDVERLCRDALIMADEIGDRFLQVETKCILSACLLPKGNFTEAIALREEFYQIGKEDKVDLFQGWALLQLSEIAIMKEEYSKSSEYLTKALLVQHAFGQSDLVWLHGLRAETFTGLGDFGSSLESALEALQVSRLSLPTSFFVLEGYSGMIAAFMSNYQSNLNSKKAKKDLKRAINAFSQYARAFPIGKPRLLFWRGEVANQSNKKRRAIKLWQAGLKRATELKMVFEMARLHENLGRNLDQNSEEARTHLKKSAEIMSVVRPVGVR